MDFPIKNLDLIVRINRFSSFVHDRVKSIGHSGAAEVFAYYIKNVDQLAGDDELVSFMTFYAEHYVNSSSQCSQDVFVLYACKCMNGGSFLEIGGADGFTHSNTYSLEKYYGWRGTLVEPEPNQFKSLAKSRSANTLINAAISPNDKEEQLTLRVVGQLSALEGYEGRDIHLATRLRQRCRARVRAISLTRLLSERRYDYFSLDVEGAEESILDSIDWSVAQKPAIVTVEHNYNETNRSNILAALNQHGYVECFADHEWLRRGDIWAKLAD